MKLLHAHLPPSLWLYGLAWLVGSALMVALIITALRLLGWWRE